MREIRLNLYERQQYLSLGVPFTEDEPDEDGSRYMEIDPDIAGAIEPWRGSPYRDSMGLAEFITKTLGRR